MTAMARPLACLVAATFLARRRRPPRRGQPAPTGGRLTGRVTDGSGAALPGVTVTLRPAGPGAPITLVTDGVGQYTSPALPPEHLRRSPSSSPASRRAPARASSSARASCSSSISSSAWPRWPKPCRSSPRRPRLRRHRRHLRPRHPRPRPCGCRRPASPKPYPCRRSCWPRSAGPGQPADASLTIGHLVAHRDEPGRRLYGRGDVLVLDVGADLGLETGQNLVVRRRFLTGDRGLPVCRVDVRRADGRPHPDRRSRDRELGRDRRLRLRRTLCRRHGGALRRAADVDRPGPGHAALRRPGQGHPRRARPDAGRAAPADGDRPRRRAGRRARPAHHDLPALARHRGPVVSIADAIIVAVRPESATIRIERASDAVRSAIWSRCTARRDSGTGG